MAIIKCPECGKEISDKAKECINCGCPIGQKEIKVAEKVDVEAKKNESKKKKITIFVSVILAIGLIVGGSFGVKHILDERRKNNLEDKVEKYKEDLESISLEMLNGAVEAEDCGNLIKKVWSNTIWKDSDKETDKFTKKDGKFREDFNDSLHALFEDKDFSEKRNKLENNKEKVTNMMKNMKNPPEGMEDAYLELKEYYDNYMTLVNLCINPSGNLTTYSSKFSDADSDAVDGFNKVKTYYSY